PGVALMHAAGCAARRRLAGPGRAAPADVRIARATLIEPPCSRRWRRPEHFAYGQALEIHRQSPICMTPAARTRPVLHVEFDDHECGNSKTNPGLPDRGEAAAAPDDSFPVFEQGNLPP